MNKKLYLLQLNKQLKINNYYKFKSEYSGNTNISESIKDAYEKRMEYYFDELGKRVSEGINKTKDIQDYLDKLNKNFIDDNSILKLYKDFQEYLSTLSTVQICLLFNIIGIIFVTFCLITIFLSFYGNFFMDKFSLEERFPKLARFIRLRRTFLHFYILTNLLYITIVLIFMMYINYVTFFI